MKKTIIYNKYTDKGSFLGERIYHPTDERDYQRVMRIFEEEPERYELVNETDYETDDE